MTRAEVLQVLASLHALNPASVPALAEACLLEFLVAEGYADVVEVYLAVLSSTAVGSPPQAGGR